MTRNLSATVNFGSRFTLFQGSTIQFLLSKYLRNNKRSPFLEIQGHLPLSHEIKYDYDLESPRGRLYKGNHYSYGYQDSSEKLSSLFRSIVLKYNADIARLLGPSFRMASPTLWRILPLPLEAQCEDIYSQVFHQDSVYDQYNLQIFVLLDDVSVQDGPFQWVDLSYHRKAFPYAIKRNKVSLPSSILVKTLTGQRGDYLLLSTGYTLHRDGIPDLGRQRLMASVGLFPNYTKIGAVFKAST